MGAVGGSKAVGGRVEVGGLVVRGGAFHNKIVEDVRAAFLSYGWEVETESCCQRDGVTTFFDIYAENSPDRIGCEIETTARHAIDNARKAETVGIYVWFVVPTRKLQRRIVRRFTKFGLISNNKSIKVLLLGDLERELAHHQSRRKQIHLPDSRRIS